MLIPHISPMFGYIDITGNISDLIKSGDAQGGSLPHVSYWKAH
jgi:hypothetical protein